MLCAALPIIFSTVMAFSNNSSSEQRLPIDRISVIKSSMPMSSPFSIGIYLTAFSAVRSCWCAFLGCICKSSSHPISGADGRVRRDVLSRTDSKSSVIIATWLPSSHTFNSTTTRPNISISFARCLYSSSVCRAIFSMRLCTSKWFCECSCCLFSLFSISIICPSLSLSLPVDALSFDNILNISNCSSKSCSKPVYLYM